MQPTKLGWNIEGADLGNRRDTIVNELKRYKANWHLCLGDEGLAIDLLNHTEKGVIYRIYDPFNEYGGGNNPTFDAEIWQQHRPQEIVDYVNRRLSHLKQYPNLVFSIGNNEPSTRGKTRDFVAWCVELAVLGHKHGIRFAIAEIASAKTIEHHEIKSGMWDDFITTMHMYRGFHIATFHEYTTGILPATFLPDYPLNLDNPSALDKHHWQTAKMNLSSIDGNYHLGRGALITHVRAKQLGYEPIPFVITECAFDWMNDIVNTPERAETLARLENRFKVPNYDFMRGSTGHQAYHEWLMKESGYTADWNTYLFAQYVWLVNAYPDECEGFTDFALNFDWDKLRGHDKSRGRNDGFRQLVINNPLPYSDQPQEPQPMPESEYNDYDVVMQPHMVHTTRSVWNIRNAPRVSGADIGDMPLTPTQAMVSVLPVNTDANYDWYKISVNGVEGFTAQSKGESTPNVLKPIVDTPTEPTDPSDMEALVQRLDADVKSLQEFIDKQFEPVVIDFPVGDMMMVVSRGFLPSVETFLKVFGYSITESAKSVQRARGGVPIEDVDIFSEPVTTTLSALPDDTGDDDNG